MDSLIMLHGIFIHLSLSYFMFFLCSSVFSILQFLGNFLRSIPDEGGSSSPIHFTNVFSHAEHDLSIDWFPVIVVLEALDDHGIYGWSWSSATIGNPRDVIVTRFSDTIIKVRTRTNDWKYRPRSEERVNSNKSHCHSLKVRNVAMSSSLRLPICHVQRLLRSTFALDQSKHALQSPHGVFGDARLGPERRIIPICRRVTTCWSHSARQRMCRIFPRATSGTQPFAC